MSESTPPAGPGKLSKRAKIGVVVAGLGVGGYFWWQQRQAAAAAAAAPATAGDGTSATDTATLGMDAGAGPGVYGATGSAASTTTVGTVSTNADWYDAALSACTDAGYDNATAATALSAYLDHQPLTTAQQTIVRIGLAAAGTPPTGSFTIITAPAPPAPTTPAVTAPPNVAVHTLGSTSFTLSWNGQPNARGYYIYTNGHKSAEQYGTTWTINSAHAGVTISPNSKYAMSVTAVDSAGHEGPHSPTITVTTKKK